jgi:hypothetical protein
MPSARTRVNNHLRPYETSLSPVIRDISVSGHTRHLRPRPYETSPAETCICNTLCYVGCFLDLLIILIDSLYLEGQRPAYVQCPICVRVCSDMRRITLVLMHIFIQPPSSYKSSFSYKTSDDAETHDPSTHATHFVTYPVASDSEWRSIKVFSDDSLYINRVFLLLCFSSPYHRIYTRFSPKYYSNTLDKKVEIEKLDCVYLRGPQRPHIYGSLCMNACLRIYV